MTHPFLPPSFQSSLPALWMLGGLLVACASLGACSAGDGSTGGPDSGSLSDSASGASTGPEAAAGTSLIDASGGNSRPADASRETSPADASLPVDATVGSSPPPDASAEASRSADASRETASPVDAAGEGSRPADAAGVDSSNLPSVTVWLAGDSTVENYVAGNAEGENGSDLVGWGQVFGQFFNAKVTVQNEAIGGRSVADFIYSVVRDDAGAFECIDDAGDPSYQVDSQGNRIDPSQWAAIKAGIKPGDYLLIQFGTNDETHDCPRFVSLPNFESDLGLMADTIRAKGATPIFVTPVAHRAFNSDGTVNDTLLPYANAMKDEANIEGLEVLDLNLASVNYYAMVGNAFLATNIFDSGTTHFVLAGATEMASLVASEIQKNNGPLASYLK